MGMRGMTWATVAVFCTLVTSANAGGAKDAKQVTMDQVMSAEELLATGVSTFDLPPLKPVQAF